MSRKGTHGETGTAEQIGFFGWYLALNRVLKMQQGAIVKADFIKNT